MHRCWLSVARFLREWNGALFPERCLVCGAGRSAICGEHAIVSGCPGRRCRRCADRIADALPAGSLCVRCRRSSPAFRRLWALGEYPGEERFADWILALKHGDRRDLARPLAELLAARVPELGAASGGLFVPVPSHPLRTLERGHDPAGLLASELARALPPARARRLLRRVRWTPPQGKAGARSRRANVRGAFAVRRGAAGRLAGRVVWLVDDVVTSAATVDACARELVRAGATAVDVVCIGRAARASPGPPNLVEAAGFPGGA